MEVPVYQIDDSEDEQSSEPSSQISKDENPSSSDEGEGTPAANNSAQTSHISVLRSVRRNEITCSEAREANEELQNLGIQAYDQSAYERGVFEQVDRAISHADTANHLRPGVATHQNTLQQSDLMNLIQTRQSSEDDDEDLDPTQRDEKILQATRQERMRIVKQERRTVEEPERFVQVRIPRLQPTKTEPSTSQVKQEPSNQREPEPNTGFEATTSGSSFWTPQSGNSDFKKPLDSDEEDQSDDNSSGSEYVPTSKRQRGSSSSDSSDSRPPCRVQRPSQAPDPELPVHEKHAPLPSSESGSSDSEPDDDLHLNEDIDYETDDSLGGRVKNGFDDKSLRRKSKRLKRLVDDGDLHHYKRRIKEYNRQRASLRMENITEDGCEVSKMNEMVNIDNRLEIPKEIWDNLFEHQKTGVKWLWELHQLGTGGILGDEMGLGKTIQIVAFLAALRSSLLPSGHRGYEKLGPTVLVCPATVMHQWLIEFRKWWAPFRVAILHSTGAFSGKDRARLVEIINRSNGILIVSYPGVVIYQDELHRFDWHYAILDEGHKIRNPDAQVTLACKRFRTPHRIILSGSPVQNNLRELWSIFDFIYPGKLGTLPVFMEQFATPITQGGYANANDIQVQIAYKCTCVLRDTIKPFLLRRTKAEVNNNLKLPERSEQVLFCKLTERQERLYKAYLESATIRDIKRGLCLIFVGLMQLRKICNHPDLFDAREGERGSQGPPRKLVEPKRKLKAPSNCFDDDEGESSDGQQGIVSQHDFEGSRCKDKLAGNYQRSGKMMVVDALLKIWRKEKHKVLLFSQSRQMLRLFKEYFEQLGYKYMCMDGTTPIGVRQTMIEEFNKNPDVFVFLLTTRVGGVGINLTGANRIIIFDPDWNPSTDIQARERAWRIGQQRHVIIYRLLTAGTIEEKIYHRQVFKLYLTNRVLKDAKQKRFFKTNDLHELFTYGDDIKNIETNALFDEDMQIKPEDLKRSVKSSLKSKRRSDKRKRKEEKRRLREIVESATSKCRGETLDLDTTTREAKQNLFTEAKLDAMRERAKALSQMIASKFKGAPEGASRREPAGAQQNIEYLVKQEPYRRPQAEAGGAERVDGAGEGREDYILERLFKNSTVFGALKHDQIESDATSDYKIVASEAERVARDAILCLRESRRHCMSSTSGIPNWTGRNGLSRPPTITNNGPGSEIGPGQRSRLVQQMMARHNRPQGDANPLIRAGSLPSSASSSSSCSSSSSSNLLGSIRKRNQMNSVSLAQSAFEVCNPSAAHETNRDFRGQAKEVGADSLAGKLRDFLSNESAVLFEARTEELIEFYNANFKPEQSAVFKAILYKLCEFRRQGPKGFWSLKTEFR